MAITAAVGPYPFEQWYENTNEPWVRFILDAYIQAGSVVTRLPMTTYGDQKRLQKRVIGRSRFLHQSLSAKSRRRRSCSRSKTTKRARI